MYDCCIRVIHNMVTSLLEYLDLSAVFLLANIGLNLFVTILLENFPSLQCKIGQFTNFR